MTTEAVFLCNLPRDIHTESDKTATENNHKGLYTRKNQRTIDYAYIYSFEVALEFSLAQNPQKSHDRFFQRLTNHVEHQRREISSCAGEHNRARGPIVNRNFFPRRASALESINAILDVLFHANSPLSVTVTM